MLTNFAVTKPTTMTTTTKLTKTATSTTSTTPPQASAERALEVAILRLAGASPRPPRQELKTLVDQALDAYREYMRSLPKAEAI